jgi:hypothetical protein
VFCDTWSFEAAEYGTMPRIVNSRHEASRHAELTGKTSRDKLLKTGNVDP